MTDSRDKNAWRDLAHTIEVVTGAAWSKDDGTDGAEKNRDLRAANWTDFAHTSDVLLASAAAQADVAASVSVPPSVPEIKGEGAAGRPRRAVAMGLGLLGACCALILAGHLMQHSSHERGVKAPLAQLGAAKRLEVVNASRSSSIVRVRLAAPNAGVSKVFDLADPIPPASIQPFWHYATAAAPQGHLCLFFFSASYANGAEARSRVDLCRDDQILVLEKSGRLFSPSANAPVAGTSLALTESGTAAASGGVLLASLDFHPEPSRRAVQEARASADGSRIVTLAEEGAVHLWDMLTGRPVATLAADGSPVRAVAFSPDGREVVMLAGESTAQRFDAATGREVARQEREQKSPIASGDVHVLRRDAMWRAEVSGDPDGAAASPERQLHAGAAVGLVRTYGPWALVTIGTGEMGYVPTEAVTRDGSGEALRVALATASRIEADLKGLERRIGELRGAARYAEAGAFAERYAEAVKGRNGPADPQYAAALETQAQLAHVGNRLAEAELLYRRVLAIRERALGRCDATVTRSMEALAEVYRAQGRLAVADELARRSRSPCTR